MAVRKPTGEVITEEMPVARVSDKHKWLKWPVLRGLGTLVQAMSLGMRALKFSANAALDEGAAAGEKPKEVSNTMMTFQLLFSLAFFIVMYKLVPLKLTEFLSHRAPILQGQILFNVVDGGHPSGHLRRVFCCCCLNRKMFTACSSLHGAEHKVVFNFESGKPVNVENAQSFVTFHPRCGTSFMFVIMLISMLVYILIPDPTFAAKLVERIVLLPVITGVSYELIRFAAKRRGSFGSS